MIPGMLALFAQTLGPAQQDYLLQARQMQALSFAVHIPLVCFGVAFPAMVLFIEWLGRRRGDPVLMALAKRWSKAMIAVFAVGVVTGTILSFELGLLWPEFMATYGGVFGLAFALEGFSFFVEGIFIAIYVYGWDRLSPRAHMLAGIPVALAGFSGSLMVLTVNGWMNNPSGFRLENGKPVDIRPWDALFGNSYFWHELVHMYLAAYIVAGFVTASVYAVSYLRGRRDRYVRVALAIPLVVAAVAAPAQVIVGDWAARDVAKTQPTKLAAFEGLGHTQKGAPIHVGGWYDAKSGKVEYGIALPKLLSLLAFHDPNAKVQGLDTVPPRDRPPVNVVRLAFATMVGVGTMMALFGVGFLVHFWRKRRLPESRWFLRCVAALGPLSVVALIAGWVTTEVGRQPWVVYKLLRTEDAVTGAGGIPIGYATLVLVYLALGAAFVWLLRRIAKTPLEVKRGSG
jgi:cytochrome bd ubiquinol oxidase subunit I